MTIYQIHLERIAGKTFDLEPLKNDGNNYIIFRDRLNMPQEMKGLLSQFTSYLFLCKRKVITSK